MMSWPLLVTHSVVETLVKFSTHEQTLPLTENCPSKVPKSRLFGK